MMELMAQPVRASVSSMCRVERPMFVARPTRYSSSEPFSQLYQLSTLGTGRVRSQIACPLNKIYISMQFPRGYCLLFPIYSTIVRVSRHARTLSFSAAQFHAATTRFFHSSAKLIDVASTVKIGFLLNFLHLKLN